MGRRVDGGDLGRTRDPGNPRRIGLILAAALGLAVLGGIAFFVAASSRNQAPPVVVAPTATAIASPAVAVVTASPTAAVAIVVTAAPTAPPTASPVPPTVAAVVVATPEPTAPPAKPEAAATAPGVGPTAPAGPPQPVPTSQPAAPPPAPPAPAPGAPAGAAAPPAPAAQPPAQPAPTSPPTVPPIAPPPVAKAPTLPTSLPTTAPGLLPTPAVKPGGVPKVPAAGAAGQGGVVVEAGQEAVLRCPNGVVVTVRRETLRQDVTLNCGPIDPATVPPTPGRRLGDLLFEVIANDGQLAELPGEVNLGVDYGDEDLAGLNEQQLVLGFLDNGRWTLAPKLATDPGNNFVSASVTRLGVYAVYSR